MLAGGMTIAAPSMMPQAAAAGALYVSAENAMFNNSFGGAQIIEVVIIDKQRDETDEIQGEPVVKVMRINLEWFKLLTEIGMLTLVIPLK